MSNVNPARAINMADSTKRALVYGGRGALGSAVVSLLKEKNWWVVSCDLVPNEDADANVVPKASDSWTAQAEKVQEEVDEHMLDGKKLDAVMCVAGGWAGGNAASADLVKNCDLMWKQSVWTSVVAAGIAARHLREGGLLVLTGAKAALEGTPGMIGYGMAKAAVHQLLLSLKGPFSGLPPGACVVGILPVTLDTPANRKGMPNADYSQWTPLDTLASKLLEWAEGNCPGAPLVEVVTKDGQTEMNSVKISFS